MNAFLRFCIDWIVQALGCVAFYIIITTLVLFFIGMYLYIVEMVDDLRTTLHQLNGNFHSITKGIMMEIKFHSEILE